MKPSIARQLSRRAANRRSSGVPGLVVIVLALAGCETVAPALQVAAAAFAKDLLSAASKNYTPAYATEVETLLTAIVEHKTGMQLAGATTPATGYPEQQPADAGMGTAYPQQPADATVYPGEQPPAAAVPPVAAIAVSLDVALLAQRSGADGSVTAEPIDDGAVLYDGRGDPGAGDKIKVFFAANCDCYVYVIGIDATGFVAQIFPDPDVALGNPVQAGREYLMPEGSTWWGLDEYRGTEHVYFIASLQPRPDIEQAMATLAGRPRSVAPTYQAVQSPALAPTRGLVKTQSAAPTKVTTAAGVSQTVTPTSFLSTVAGADLVITRWFEHR